MAASAAASSPAVRTRTLRTVLLAEPHVHRTLAYLAALDRQGFHPPGTAVEAYASQPDPEQATYSVHMLAAYRVALKSMRSWGKVVEPGEDMVTYLCRMNWAEADGGQVVLTDLGRAFTRALEQQEADTDTVLDVVLEPGDPLALVRVVGKIAEVGPALLVDPYFRLDQLGHIATVTKVERVLTSKRVTEADRQVLELGVKTLTLDRPFEVRVAPKELHDRFLIPATGEVRQLGSSLNSVGSVVTVFSRLRDGAEQLRGRYEDMWRDAAPLASAQSAAATAP